MYKLKLSDCVKEINNRTTENNQYEVLTSSKYGIFSQEEYFDKQVASKDNTGYKIIKKGQFTYRSMSDSGTFTINRLEDKEIGIVSPAYPVFEATNIDAEFLKYYFKSELFNKAIINLSQGSTRTALKFKDLIDIEIYLPEIEEQKKIVKILKNNDQVIEKYDELIKEKEQFIKSQFVEMFGNVITNDKKWELKQWKQILTIKNGKSQKDVEDNNGRYPIYGSGGIIGYANNYICNENTIIIGRKGSINKPFVVYEKFWNVDTAFGIEPMFNKISLSYLYMFCLIYNFNRLDQASTIPSLTKNDLLNIKIPVPPINIQGQFEQIVQLIDKQKFNYINKIKSLKEIINIFLGGKKYE